MVTSSHSPVRIAPLAFAAAKGHLGHQHVPSQPDGHWDPGALDIHKLFRCIGEAEEQFK